MTTAEEDDSPYLPPPKKAPRKKPFAEFATLLVHSEAHRLITDLEDAVKHFTVAECPDDILAAYAVLGQRRRELHGWISQHTPKPSANYSLRLRF